MPIGEILLLHLEHKPQTSLNYPLEIPAATIAGSG